MIRHASMAVLLACTWIILTGCSRSDPGPLTGTWRVRGPVPITLEFRPGETEGMGIIERVSYEGKGNDVIVNYESGPMKGAAFRFTMIGPNAARSQLGMLERIKR